MPNAIRSLCLCILTLLPVAGCAKNVATGDRFFNTLSPQQEIQIGSDAKPELVKQFGGEVQNARLRAYVSSIGSRMAALTEADNPKLPWEFTLLNSSVINAFALPGGKVFMSRGLLEQMTNEAQLAGVLGHEIGHVTAQHTARRIGQASLIGGSIEVLGAVVGASGEGTAIRTGGEVLLPALNVGGQLLILKFGREEESQSDSLGMRYMSKAGYNPNGQLQVMQILKAAASGGAQPEFMSTHPLPETRIAQIQREIKQKYADIAPRTDNYFEQRFQQECLAILRTLPPPSKQAEAAAQSIMLLAQAHASCGPGCAAHSPAE